MILTVCFSDTVYKVTRNIIFMKRPTLIWEMYNAKHQKPKYVFPWNRTLKARVDFKSKTGYGLRKKLRKPNPNRIAVQLNLWKLCISAKSQKQLVLAAKPQFSHLAQGANTQSSGNFGHSIGGGLFMPLMIFCLKLKNWYWILTYLIFSLCK